MKEALDRVKQVLTVSNLAPHLAYVHVADGWMSASDGRLYASAPVDCREEFLVSGREMERALSFDKDMVMHRTEAGLRFQKGRSRINLKCLGSETFAVMEQPDEWRPLAPGYLDALFRVSKFTSENATQGWAMGVMTLGDNLVATNNVVLAAMYYSDPPISGIIPVWLIKFLKEMKEEPVACWDSTNKICFQFADGSWIQSLRIEGDIPEQMGPFVQNLYERPTDIWEIPSEWRSVYQRTLEFSKRDITVTPTGISAASDTADITTEIETPVGIETLWDHKFLGPVLEEATHWDITHCGTLDQPQHTFWYGTGIRGLVVGKRRLAV